MLGGPEFSDQIVRRGLTVEGPLREHCRFFDIDMAPDKRVDSRLGAKVRHSAQMEATPRMSNFTLVVRMTAPNGGAVRGRSVPISS